MFITGFVLFLTGSAFLLTSILLTLIANETENPKVTHMCSAVALILSSLCYIYSAEGFGWI